METSQSPESFVPLPNSKKLLEQKSKELVNEVINQIRIHKKRQSQNSKNSVEAYLVDELNEFIHVKDLKLILEYTGLGGTEDIAQITNDLSEPSEQPLFI